MIDETDLKDYAAGDVRATSRDGQEMAREIIRLRARVRALEEALVWCSGSSDFSVDGVARVGFEKLCLPLLQSIAPTDVQRTEPNE